MARELPTKKSLLSELDELESRLIFSPISPRGDGISSSKFPFPFRFSKGYKALKYPVFGFGLIFPSIFKAQRHIFVQWWLMK